MKTSSLCVSFQQQLYDKVMDIATYAVVIGLTHRFYTSTSYAVLWILWGWRVIGVYQFWRTRHHNVFLYYPDMVNAWMLIQCLLNASPFLNAYRYSVYSIILVLKWIYEWVHHGQSGYFEK